MFWPRGKDCVVNPPNFVFGDASMMVEMVADQVVGWHQSVTSTISPLNRKKVDCQVMSLCWCFSLGGENVVPVLLLDAVMGFELV
jgi:hypothetical protein